jgi:hypothetical protein
VISVGAMIPVRRLRSELAMGGNCLDCAGSDVPAGSGGGADIQRGTHAVAYGCNSPRGRLDAEAISQRATRLAVGLLMNPIFPVPIHRAG